MIRLCKEIVDDNYVINNLKSQLLISRIYGTIITCICFLFIIGYMKKNNDSIDTIAEINFQHEVEMIALNNQYELLKQDSEYVYQQLSSMSNTIVELSIISQSLDEANQQLMADNIELLTVIDVYQGREELFNKYEYALFDTAGKRTDIKYEQLPTLELLVEESSIPDTDIILAMIMTESGGNQNAKNKDSTAKGFGQFLDTTSKFVYTNLLNMDGWSPSVSLDGDINLQMTVAYMDYLYKLNGRNLIESIRDYRGIDDISSYVATIDKYLSNVNKSVSIISRYDN